MVRLSDQDGTWLESVRAFLSARGPGDRRRESERTAEMGLDAIGCGVSSVPAPLMGSWEGEAGMMAQP